jgi:hypothetical protein
MGSRFVLSIGTVGLALATAFAPRAEAQTANPVTVCKNGTRMASNDSKACEGRGGVDLRNTAIARHDEELRAQNARDAAIRAQANSDPRYGTNNNGTSNGAYGDDRYGHNDNGRWDDHDNGRRGNDGRWNGHDNGRRGNGRYSNAPREVYRWAGYVDREIRIQLQGGNAYIQPMGNHEPRTGRGQTLAGLPRQDGVLRVERVEGRGSVDVIQQPNASNGYTATLRVRDPNSGASPYRLVAYWQPLYSDGRYGRN